MSSAAAPAFEPFDLHARIDAFLSAFNANDLDTVMTFFAEDAVYRPGDGKEHIGRAAIRAAFEPQFAGAYGKLRFDEMDRVMDHGARKVTLCWVWHARRQWRWRAAPHAAGVLGPGTQRALRLQWPGCVSLPHVHEQPFTRSQSGVFIAPHVRRVRVRAHDRLHGFGGRTVSVDLEAIRAQTGPGKPSP